MGAIDLVFPYVDCTDKVWQAAYRRTCEQLGRSCDIDQVRFRSWDLLRYFFRGIEQNMPFIRNVYMIVSNKEQVPRWVDQKQVHIILHKDIIPEKYLPTFSSPTIEMFIGNIPGLSEQFIYANDDLFTLAQMKSSDFFTDDGKVKLKFVNCRQSEARNNFDRAVSREYFLIAKYFNTVIADPDKYIRPEHSLVPMLKSQVNAAKAAMKLEIDAVAQPFRTDNDLNQYIYSYFAYFNQKTVSNRLKFEHIGSEYQFNRIKVLLRSHTLNVLCLNDDYWPHLNSYKAELQAKFEERFNKRSKYELASATRTYNPVNTDGIYLYF